MSLAGLNASLTEVSKSQRFKAAAARRLEDAKRHVMASAGRGPSVAALALRELDCAMAVAEEWGLTGRAGRSC